MAIRAAIEQDSVDDDVSASVECVLRAAKILPDHPGLGREVCLVLNALLMKDLLNPARVGQKLFHRAFSTGVVAVGLHPTNMQVQEAGSKFILEMLHFMQDNQSDLVDDETWTALHTRGMRNIFSNLHNRAAYEDPHRAALTLQMASAFLKSKHGEDVARVVAVADGHVAMDRVVAMHQVTAVCKNLRCC